jgi:hypothetical protein
MWTCGAYGLFLNTYQIMLINPPESYPLKCMHVCNARQLNTCNAAVSLFAFVPRSRVVC